MKITLQNIGIIKEAEINVDGITVIAGLNDSGKSTVGKILYALIRGVNIDENRFYSSKNEFIRNKIRDIRNLVLRTKSQNENDEKIKSKFVELFLEKESLLLNAINFRVNEKDSVQINTLNEELDNIIELFNDFSNATIKEQLTSFINEVKKRTSISIDSKEVLEYELETFFETEFGNQIQNKFETEDSVITVENINETQKIIFKETIQLEGFDDLTNFYFEDVFFIESPIKLRERNVIYFDKIMRDKNQYLNHKIYGEKKEQDIFSDSSIKIKKLNNLIIETINGSFNVNSKKELVFKREEVEFELGNVATGIKSFGILQMLLDNGVLNSNTLLILDEPEVHLHPTWQVKYAEILVRLSKEFAIPIILTSHSPYFIEAIDAYSKKLKFNDTTNFYFSRKNDNGLSSSIINVTENINPILSTISDAFYKIQDVVDELQ